MRLERIRPPIEKPVPTSSAFVMIDAMTIQNRIAESTSPCFTPLRILTCLDVPSSVLFDSVELP